LPSSDERYPEQGYGLQPRGSERGEATTNAWNELSYAVAVLSPPVVPPGVLPTAPSTPVAPVQAGAFLASTPPFVEKIGCLESNAQSLNQLV
jgi:hypothetical protein